MNEIELQGYCAHQTQPVIIPANSPLKPADLYAKVGLEHEPQRGGGNLFFFRSLHLYGPKQLPL